MKYYTGIKTGGKEMKKMQAQDAYERPGGSKLEPASLTGLPMSGVSGLCFRRTGWNKREETLNY